MDRVARGFIERRSPCWPSSTPDRHGAGRGGNAAGAALAGGRSGRHHPAQGLRQRLRRRHRGGPPRHARHLAQPRGRLGQRAPAADHAGDRARHRRLRHGFRADHAVGAEPWPDADPCRTSWCWRRPRPPTGWRASRRTIWVSTSWPRAARCWPGSSPGSDAPRQTRTPRHDRGPSQPHRHGRAGVRRPREVRGLRAGAAWPTSGRGGCSGAWPSGRRSTHRYSFVEPTPRRASWTGRACSPAAPSPTRRRACASSPRTPSSWPRRPWPGWAPPCGRRRSPT